jgi:hypothetical protein
MPEKLAGGIVRNENATLESCEEAPLAKCYRIGEEKPGKDGGSTDSASMSWLRSDLPQPLDMKCVPPLD